ncbi:hypothetical protein GCM10010140_71190 [Streptosporangium pseudovulgare]|uniref:Uncharacterized protein n=1 Tax=Streptosporangium pseudovulgare TaxID=35765 RepID=A0ABQ2RH67_9ACTN|nr:hypothetical protein GCM10010140_71190 [Streptosporangium pseudovulgare]
MNRAAMSETLREEQGGDHEDHQHDGDRQTGGVDRAHRRSTALTMSPRITNNAIVRATKTMSAISTPEGFVQLLPAVRTAAIEQGNRGVWGFLGLLTGSIRCLPRY